MNKVLVIGGGGFIGRAIITSLLEEGVDCSVVGRNSYPDLLEAGVNCCVGDIRDPKFITRQLKGFDTIFHVAALAGIWGKWEDYYSINVRGTENIISACRENNIPVLIYTSTPSVVFDRQDITNGNEILPYPTRFLCNYAQSKAMAERKVLLENGNGLKTCAIRPHLVWGPGDPHLIPRLVARGKSQSLKIVGNGKNMVDITYVDNVAHAHILAALDLHSAAKSAGKSYFIGQERPVLLWEWINDLFSSIGIKRVVEKVPLPIAYGIGALLETWHHFFLPEREPRMTRFLAEQLAKSHYFSHKNAQKDLGYTPVVTIEEGMEKVRYWLKTK